jgi:hypothetical protein
MCIKLGSKRKKSSKGPWNEPYLLATQLLSKLITLIVVFDSMFESTLRKRQTILKNIESHLYSETRKDIKNI